LTRPWQLFRGEPSSILRMTQGIREVRDSVRRRNPLARQS